MGKLRHGVFVGTLAVSVHLSGTRTMPPRHWGYGDLSPWLRGGHDVPMALGTRPHRHGAWPQAAPWPPSAAQGPLLRPGPVARGVASHTKGVASC